MKREKKSEKKQKQKENKSWVRERERKRRKAVFNKLLLHENCYLNKVQATKNKTPNSPDRNSQRTVKNKQINTKSLSTDKKFFSVVLKNCLICWTRHSVISAAWTDKSGFRKNLSTLVVRHLMWLVVRSPCVYICTCVEMHRLYT